MDDDMERRRIEELQRAWRAAESRGDEAAADAALAALFVALPLEAPGPGFAAATLARVRRQRESLAAVPVPAAAPASPAAVRWAAATLAFLSLGTLALSVVVVEVLPRLALGGAVAAFNRTVVAAWEWIAGGVTLWFRAAEWSALLGRVVATPEVGWTLIVSALAALGALSLLRRILAHEKELIHARPH